MTITSFPVYDLVCVGFGPASLAIAIALSESRPNARVLFLERQSKFAWHSGMLLPGTRMQISFLKDLATMRNPRSHFTFTNYLHEQGRLVNFTNLGTFLPLREEFNDYLSWCADHFVDVVRYSHSVEEIVPVDGQRQIREWDITATNEATGTVEKFTTRNVVIAIGGRPSIPDGLSSDPRIIHSSRYSSAIPALLSDSSAPYKIAVIGAGQSSAEIFQNLGSKYPNAKTSLFIRSHALKPSDDSPFVNEIFNPERVDEVFAMDAETRRKFKAENAPTNYSVVRLELIEEIYNEMYLQRLRSPDERTWKHKIHALREVVGQEWVGEEGRVRLKLRNTRTGEMEVTEDTYDAVVCGTGYKRDVHERLMAGSTHLLRDGSWAVGRDYAVLFKEGAVAQGSGVYLQGCCEKTHGLSDSLLSILAVRAGEMVNNIFGEPAKANGVSKKRFRTDEALA
ncbi:L-lysine 6-monooxygenase (NADPH-requiring)-domain-containing protein [Pyronema domesticum]|uniref:L-ornithine N(5)-monooxygenase [NAD(P)H] n=1 Tax=Pyronema omphalodes (strain CBS 100304) TaxID=1076935 RepID=U4LA57_PYROM|nr:L-lysine 6-monooxygenase (NADPH-requiring)-domain-containing protein [Pyronema domesticum]CCX16267.1 Similar to L-ornithine 5-monooxygenase; acc. no. Q51548 [Pyronema omphalodes CBS 100304]